MKHSIDERTIQQSDTPRVDGYLRLLYKGQMAINHETMNRAGLQESDLKPSPSFTPEQEALLAHMEQCIEAARKAEREGRQEAVLPSLRAFMEVYQQFLQSLRENDQEGKSNE